jgi:N-acetylneuraminic acid mutarotase
MTDQRELDRLLGAFFREGTDEPPDRLVDAALDAALHQIDHTRQWRGPQMPRRFPTMPMFTRYAVAALGVLVIGGALYMMRPGPAGVGNSSPTPGVSASPIESAIPSPSARAASWTATGSMARSCEFHDAVLLHDGKVLVVGGNSNMADPAAEVYNPRTGTWTATGPMVTPGWQFAAARLLDGRVLVASGDGTSTATELYDPSTGSWTATGSMGTARYYTTLTLLPDGKVLLAGGDTVTHFFNPSVASAELYDPVTGSWTATGSMGTARSGHTATLLRDGKVLVAGGSNDNDTLSYRLASAELYDPATGTWTPTHDMTEIRSSHTATLLGDGRVLVVGGWGEGISATAEVYDPTTDSWAATGSLRAPLMGFTATLLHDGSVLVAGGMDTRPINASDTPASAAAEVYDPSAGTWGATGDLIQARTRHTATLLPDARVLVAGGISVRGSYDSDVLDRAPGWLSSAELYDAGSR